MNDTEIKIEHRRDGRRVILTARAGDQVLHQDTIAIGSAKARAAFLDALSSRCPGADRQALEDELLRDADFYAKQQEPEAGKARANGKPIILTDPELWPEEVDGAVLLSDIAATIRRYLVLPQHAPEAMALWVLFAHTHDVYHVSPILLLSSPVKQCGKSRALELLAGLLARPLMTSGISPSFLFRAVESFNPSLLIDEFDATNKDNELLRGVINSGWQRSAAFTGRSDSKDNGLEPKLFSTWCPKVLAMIGNPWDTVQDRTITIRMQRKGPGEQVERWRADRSGAILAPLARRAARWAADHLDELRDADPVMPQIASDRAADNWRNLIAIADLAGGPWPALARTTAETMSAIPADDDSARILLLADLRDLFTTRSVDRLTSQEVADHLGDLEDRPWPEWKAGKPISKNQVARLLKPFGVRPTNLRLPLGSVAKGYLRSDLEPVFNKYLPTTPFQNATPLQAGNDTGNQPNQSATRSGSEAPDSLPDRTCSGVADEKGGGRGSEAQRGFRFSLGTPDTTPRPKSIIVRDLTCEPEEV